MKKQNRFTGQTLVEFALLLPILLLLVMGLFEFGRFVLFYAVLNTAVREGTRYAVVQPSCDFTSDPIACTGGYVNSIFDSGCCCPSTSTSEVNIRICEEIESKYFNLEGLSNSGVIITYNGSDDPKINIRIEHDYNPILPGLGLIGNLQITAESEMLLAPIAVLQ